MKSVVIIFFICVSVFASSCSKKLINSVSESDKEVVIFADEVLKTFKKEDDESFINLMAPPEAYMKKGDFKQNREAKAAYEERRKQLRASFNNLLKIGNQKEIVWRKTRLDTVLYTTEPIKEDSILRANIIIQFKNDIVPYQVKLIKAERINQKWFLGDSLIWIGIQPYKIRE